jgi:flagellar biosynthesis protein FlhG
MGELFVKLNNQQAKPYTISELSKLATSGKFVQDDLVYIEDSQEWVKAANVTELHRVFHPSVQPVAQRTIYAVGGGKGGVGKTVLTASLGIGLASLGNRVVIVDADLGGANLHTCMGILEPEFTFYHFYTLQKETLADIMLETPIDNLKLISGACGTLGLANPRYSQKLRFINELRRIQTDYVLLDLGAGSSFNVIDFFVAADQGIVVTTPEPMAIQETFNFLKIALMRKLMRHFKNQPEIASLFEQDVFVETLRIGATLDSLLQKIRAIDSAAGTEAEQVFSAFKPSLILNMVHAQDEIKEGVALVTAVEELLSIELEFLGYIDYDDSVRKAVKELRPFMIDNPNSKASKSLARLISVGLQGKSGWKGFLDRRRVIRQTTQQAKSYPRNQIKESETICSVQCFYWGDCEYQNGGFPCPVRHLDPIFRR